MAGRCPQPLDLGQLSCVGQDRTSRRFAVTSSTSTLTTLRLPAYTTCTVQTNTLSDPTPDRSWQFCSVLDPKPVSHFGNRFGCAPRSLLARHTHMSRDFVPTLPAVGGQGEHYLPAGHWRRSRSIHIPLSPRRFPPTLSLSLRRSWSTTLCHPSTTHMAQRQTDRRLLHLA